jgi:hypothetical protein
MKNKIFGVVFIISTIANSFAAAELGPRCKDFDEYMRASGENTSESTNKRLDLEAKCKYEKQTQVEKQQEEATAQDNAKIQENGISRYDQCKTVFETTDKEFKAATEAAPKKTALLKKGHLQCLHLKALSQEFDEKYEINQYLKREVVKFSQDQKIRCDKPNSYTVDYDACLKALAAYNFIINSEAFMDLQQKIRTDVKNSNINREAQKTAASGDSQTAMFDAGIESNKHMKQMQAEKAAAYSMAVMALTRALSMMKGEDEAIDDCQDSYVHFKMKDQEKAQINIQDQFKKACESTVKSFKRTILANEDTKASLWEAITQFTAKGLAAGIAMGQYKTKADAIAAAKKPFQEEGADMMIELCEANPTDPACVQRGNRVSGGALSAGEFSFGGESGNNAFNMNPEEGAFGEAGASSNLDDKNSVASINSPFQDEAKLAKDILGPAGAAQTQATGGAAGGGGGGGAGGGGGGSASLGGDLSGADKDGDKEAQIKTGKVSGTYGNLGGGGYKGISRGKDDANPFSSLFDQKGEGGGVEEDRSIASGDIDGKASGLFEKISKRYGQIKADKRVEAKNLE